MRSPRAVSTTAKILISLAIGAPFQIAPGTAATKCPSGQILRVSLGICVPKGQNLSLLSTHVAKPKPAKDPATSRAVPESGRDAAISRDRSLPPAVEMAAQREAPPAAEPRPAPPPAQDNAAPLASFGNLFVGAFRSTMSMGASAFK